MSLFVENQLYDDNTLAIDDAGYSVKYNDLHNYTHYLEGIITDRCLVFLFTSNSIGSVINYLALLRNRIVPVLLNCQLEKQLVDDLLEAYSPEYIIIPEAQQNEYEEFECVDSQYEYCVLKTNYEKKYGLYDELALLLTTSGSTGSPKLVRQSYKNIDANAASIAGYLALNDTERPITTLPMNYTYGLSIINSHVLVGATILVTDKSFMQKEFWNFFKTEEATSFGGVPYNYEMLDKLRFFRMQLPSLRTMTQAGGKLSPELHKKFAEYAQAAGKNFIVMYGQCEATARMAYLPPEKSLEKYGSMGIAIPGGKFYLIDANGKEIINSDETGELVYEGDNVTLGYAECGSDLIKGDERNGRLQTGDMAKRDEDGFYYIVGRKKRFLKVYGNRVNLDETERLLKTQFSYIDCACGGVDDHMYIFITDSSLENEVKTFISGITHLNSAAFEVVTLEQIPKNDSGKTRYAELAQYYN